MSSKKDLFSHLAPVLQVEKLDDSIEFYRHSLGFEVKFIYEDPATYAVLGRGEQVRIHLSKAEKPVSGHKQTSIYLFVRDVDLLYQEFLEKGVEMLNKPTTWDYGMRDFDLKDPDGFVLSFGMYVGG